MNDEKIKDDSERCSEIINSIIKREGVACAIEILASTLVMVCQNQAVNASAYLAAMRLSWGTDEKENLH